MFDRAMVQTVTRRPLLAYFAFLRKEIELKEKIIFFSFS